MPTLSRLFVISGPSGAGKGTLIARLREKRPDLGLTVSATTRKPRETEKEGLSYYFLADEEFSRMVDQEEFLEWDEHFGYRYGTPNFEVERHLAEGHSVLLELDVHGALNVRKKRPEAVLVFIEPPSLEELEQRLRARGTEDEQEIANRLARAALELELSKEYNACILNDDIERATQELAEVIESYERAGGMLEDVCD